MKKLFYVLGLVMALVFTSCDKADLETKKNLVGTWEAVSYDSCIYLDDVLQSRESESAASGQVTMTFNSDHTYAISEGNNHTSGEWELSEGYLSLMENSEEEYVTVKATITPEVLAIIVDEAYSPVKDHIYRYTDELVFKKIK